MDYDLELLQSMLECNCDENNMVNEPTYSFIIRKWVSNVQDRTPASPPEPLLEVQHSFPLLYLPSPFSSPPPDPEQTSPETEEQEQEEETVEPASLETGEKHN